MTFIRRLARTAVSFAVLAFAVQLAVGVLGPPPALVRWMVGADEPACPDPSCIVVLGGGGIPSESGLIRTYHAARLAVQCPSATVVVSLPADRDPETSSVGRMRDELVLRGVPRRSVRLEYRGRNTHEQAEDIRELLGPAGLAAPVVIVSSPAHIRRSLLCFRKAGFAQVTGFAAYSIGAEGDLGPGTSYRYAFWSNQQIFLDYLRELIAMAVYKVRGWV